MIIIKNNIVTQKSYAFGKAFILNNKKININKNKIISKKNINNEINNFLKTYNKTINQFNKIISYLSKKNKKIFKLYIVILKNSILKKEIINLIRNKKIYADASINFIINKYINNIRKIKNFYFRKKINNLLDIKKRLIYNLYNIKFIDLDLLKYVKDNIIIISDNIFPSQIIEFNVKKIVGIIIELGNKFSYSSIISKSLNLINVIKVNNITKLIRNNDYIIIDGIKGDIYINPDKNKISILKKKCNILLNKKNI